MDTRVCTGGVHVRYAPARATPHDDESGQLGASQIGYSIARRRRERLQAGGREEGSKRRAQISTTNSLAIWNRPHLRRCDERRYLPILDFPRQEWWSQSPSDQRTTWRCLESFRLTWLSMPIVAQNWANRWSCFVISWNYNFLRSFSSLRIQFTVVIIDLPTLEYCNTVHACIRLICVCCVLWPTSSYNKYIIHYVLRLQSCKCTMHTV